MVHLWVSCYDDFEQLAHAPRGTPATNDGHTLRAYHLDTKSGELTLKPTTLNQPRQAQAPIALPNPAFMRHHPTKHVLYVVTESIQNNGRVLAYKYDPADPDCALTPLSDQSAEGASTCYVTIDRACQWLLSVSYWDSVISVLPMGADGSLRPAPTKLPPPAQVRATSLEDHLANRQSEPHAHAIVLDPIFGRIAFVPDLGTDVVRQYVFLPVLGGGLAPAGAVACGPPGHAAHGPRYIEFCKLGRNAFVVNELSSSVSVFRFESELAAHVADKGPDAKNPRALLTLLQLVSTLPLPAPPPTAYSLGKNTCGRVAVCPSGRHLLVSNRGHDSIAVFALERPGGYDADATLRPHAIIKTMGGTPRHFQFAAEGRYVIVANQDTDNLSVFRFDSDSGALEFTGKTAACPSPNFVCAQPPAVRSSSAYPIGVCNSNEW